MPQNPIKFDVHISRHIEYFKSSPYICHWKQKYYRWLMLHVVYIDICCATINEHIHLHMCRYLCSTQTLSTIYCRINSLWFLLFPNNRPLIAAPHPIFLSISHSEVSQQLHSLLATTKDTFQQTHTHTLHFNLLALIIYAFCCTSVVATCHMPHRW